jgi:hypothetical protein
MELIDLEHFLEGQAQFNLQLQKRNLHMTPIRANQSNHGIHKCSFQNSNIQLQ